MFWRKQKESHPRLPDDCKKFLSEGEAIFEELTDIQQQLKPHLFKGRRVLICDDDVALCQMLRMALDREGIRCQIAYDGKQCLQRIIENDIGALIVDLHMPGLSGEDVLRILKDAKFKTFVITGDITEREKRRFECTYGATVFHKPFKLADIQRAISAALAPI